MEGEEAVEVKTGIKYEAEAGVGILTLRATKMHIKAIMAAMLVDVAERGQVIKTMTSRGQVRTKSMYRMIRTPICKYRQLLNCSIAHQGLLVPELRSVSLLSLKIMHSVVILNVTFCVIIMIKNSSTP